MVLWVLLLYYHHNWDLGTRPLLEGSWNGGWKGKVSLVDTHRISLEHSMAFPPAPVSVGLLNPSYSLKAVAAYCLCLLCSRSLRVRGGLTCPLAAGPRGGQQKHPQGWVHE